MRDYDDMLDMLPPVSSHHPRMSRLARAAQFAPYAALVGFEALVDEEARTTENKIVLAEEEKHRISDMLRNAMNLVPPPRILITFFVPDARKSGGSYVTRGGTIVLFDTCKRIIRLDDGSEIVVDDITDVSEE